MRSGVLVLCLCACGQVDKTVQDAPSIDAYQPDSPAACGAGQMLCGGACEDVMTSIDHCGSCTTQCDPTQTCGGGACISQFCARVRQMNAAATDGLYPNPNPGATGDIYCDFTNGKTYLDFRIGAFTSTPSGYTLARSTDFANPGFAQAFIAFFNSRHGVPSAAAFGPSNCCFTTIAGQRLQLGASFTFPGIAGQQTNCAFMYTVDTVYTISRTQTNGYIDQLPTTYFTDFPPTEATGCGDAMNPAYYYRRRDSLN